jgi:hypothetical protein
MEPKPPNFGTQRAQHPRTDNGFNAALFRVRRDDRRRGGELPAGRAAAQHALTAAVAPDRGDRGLGGKNVSGNQSIGGYETGMERV